jgi:DNA processing protein
MEERNYYLGFSSFPGIGPMKFKILLTRFGSAKNAWETSASELKKIIGEKLAEEFDEFRKFFSIENYISELAKKDVSFVILSDKDYPELLKKIKNPPFVLYIKGNKEILLRQLTDQDDSARTVAVVGARRTTQYGREVTKLLTQELVANGFTIVSGLAMGVDAISHKTAIENNGKTIAVLGCGVDCCYPKENQSIYNSIVANNSLVVSEYPLAQLPTKGSFPSRNRIIAGLSMGVLVTEGAEDSGSLITADYARKFGRPVFAVPGPITSSMSKGPYKLIAKGAKLVTSAKDILDELGIRNHELGSIKGGKSIKSIKGGSPEENMILKLLQNEPMHFDELVRKSGLQSSSVGSMLSVMEMKGMVKSLEGGIFGL